jgi:hypothetical protein
MSQELPTALNPGETFETAGRSIVVADIADAVKHNPEVVATSNASQSYAPKRITEVVRFSGQFDGLASIAT